MPVTVEGINLGLSATTGAVIVHTKKNLRGRIIDLTRYFSTGHGYNDTETFAQAHVAEYTINGRKVFAAIFKHVTPPDNGYLAVTSFGIPDGFNRVAISPGDVVEIDWR